MQRLNGPPTDFVGHPLGEQVGELRPDTIEAQRRQSDPPLLVVLPGSRSGEIRRLAQVFGSTVMQVADRVGALEVVVPTIPRLAGAVREAVASWRVQESVNVRIVTEPDAKHLAFRQARAALTKSGTSTLELALAGVPMVAAYKVTFLEEMVGRLLVKVPSFILANLVLGENVVPEFLQYQCTPETLGAALMPLLSDTPERRRQVEAFGRLDGIMDIGGPASKSTPSDRAATLVLQAVRDIEPSRP
jgi:lipid-A-disaccharide synthase